MNAKPWQHTRFYDWLMVGLLLFFCIYYGYQHLINLEPQSRHMWRQADCASFTWNYYKTTWNLFEPHFSNLTYGNGTGKAAVEFPILYWMAGMTNRIVGPAAWPIRGLNLLIFLGGLYAFYRTGRRLLKDPFWSIFLPLLLFTSPMLAYYANNFLPDTPSLGLSLMGWAAFIAFSQDRKQRQLILSILLFSLATLIKASSGISLVALAALFMTEINGWGSLRAREEGLIFKKPLTGAILTFLLSCLAIGGWYVYATWYSVKFTDPHFLTLIRPVHELSYDKVFSITAILITTTFKQIFHPFTHTLILFLTFFIFARHARQHILLHSICLLMLIGSTLYILIFFGLLDIHDYYFIAALIAPAWIFLYATYLIQQHYPGLFNSYVFRFLISGFLFFNLYTAKMHVQMHYYGGNQHLSAMKEYYEPELKTYLKEVGVSEEKRIISISDISPNITLHLMERKGWSLGDYPNPEGNFLPDNIKSRPDADFLIISDSTILNRELIKPFLTKPVGRYKRLFIFGLK